MDIIGIQLYWFLNFLIKKTFGQAITNEIMFNKELAKKLEKPITRKFKKRKVYSSFIDNILGADLADMHLISNLIREFFLFCVINIFSRYAWIIPLKDKKVLQLLMLFKILDESNIKPKKIWVDKRSEFYNKSLKLWQQKNAIEMCNQ